MNPVKSSGDPSAHLDAMSTKTRGNGNATHRKRLARQFADASGWKYTRALDLVTKAADADRLPEPLDDDGMAKALEVLKVMSTETSAEATSAEDTECHAARTGEGYWTCDVPGGCADCRALAAEIDDTEQIAAWDAERAEQQNDGTGSEPTSDQPRSLYLIPSFLLALRQVWQGRVTKELHPNGAVARFALDNKPASAARDLDFVLLERDGYITARLMKGEEWVVARTTDFGDEVLAANGADVDKFYDGLPKGVGHLPVERNPYVGAGADGARRSAEIDRTEADGLDRDDPRRDEVLASAERWDQQAVRAEQEEAVEELAAERAIVTLGEAERRRLIETCVATCEKESPQLGEIARLWFAPALDDDYDGLPPAEKIARHASASQVAERIGVEASTVRARIVRIKEIARRVARDLSQPSDAGITPVNAALAAVEKEPFSTDEGGRRKASEPRRQRIWDLSWVYEALTGEQGLIYVSAPSQTAADRYVFGGGYTAIGDADALSHITGLVDALRVRDDITWPPPVREREEPVIDGPGAYGRTRYFVDIGREFEDKDREHPYWGHPVPQYARKLVAVDTRGDQAAAQKAAALVLGNTGWAGITDAEIMGPEPEGVIGWILDHRHVPVERGGIAACMGCASPHLKTWGYQVGGGVVCKACAAGVHGECVGHRRGDWEKGADGVTTRRCYCYCRDKAAAGSAPKGATEVPAEAPDTIVGEKPPCMICGKPSVLDVQAEQTLDGHRAGTLRITLCAQHRDEYHRPVDEPDAGQEVAPIEVDGECQHANTRYVDGYGTECADCGEHLVDVSDARSPD